VAPGQRAQAAALVFFFSNILGLGLGPLFVGYISDLTADELGSRSISLALSVSMIALLAAAVCYYFSALAMAKDIKKQHQ